MSYCLISWGANSHGQLGQGIQSEECVSPREVNLSKCSLEPQKINKIVGGAGHTLILDDYGRVYSCGWNNKGQTGFPVKEDVLSFRELNGKLKGKVVIDVACGWDCSAALTIEGTLFLWGSNCFGQLGEHPRVSIGLRHIALVTEDRKILVAGAGNKGQLGLSSSENEKCLNAVYTFTEVPTLINVDDVSCGQHHTIVVTKDRNLYAFGDNKHGQLGLDTDTISKTSSPIKLSNFQSQLPIKIHSGWSHVIALNDGQIFCWGRNTYGQLGIADLQRPASWKAVRIKNLSKIQQISVGSEHNVALTENGKLLCWGWNEHGNCGNGHKTDVQFPEQLSLSYDYTGILVGSGAGHSFAVIKKS
ncbi:Secretion-regulating guanine nucleotide exchange factor [Anthophora quadrimaculata]